MAHPVPASAHPGVEAAHDAVFAAPHRPWWTHAHATASFEEQLAAAVAAQAPFFPDLSEHNGPANWDLIEAAWRAGLVLAVAMRAGFGTVRADKQFARNQTEARRRGIPNIPYWFCYSAYNAPAAEAQMFNAVVGELRPGEAMCGDFEDDPNARPFVRGAAGLRWCQDFLSALRAPDPASWAYSNSSLISVIGLQPLAQRFTIWQADWSATPDSAFGLAAMRQFTNCGSTPGVNGCCDQSRVLRGPLARWLTPGGAPAPQPAISTTGGIGMGATTWGFRIGDTDHVFDVSPQGDLLWWRGEPNAGAGGQVHAGRAGWWNVGGTGVPGGIRDAAIWESGGQIIVRAKFVTPNPTFASAVAEDHPDDLLRVAARAARELHAGADLAASPESAGLALGCVLWPNAATLATAYALSWFQYDAAGPFRLPSLPGAAGAPGPQGEPGPPVSDDEVAEVVKAVVKSAAAAL